MERISETKIKKVLRKLGADAAVKELILNNVAIYNDLIEQYEALEDKARFRNIYGLINANQSIAKELTQLRKEAAKKNQGAGDGDDPLKEMLEKLGKKSKKQQVEN